MKHWCVFLFVCVLLGGTLCPPSVCATGYLLFATSMEGSECQVYEMSADGDLKPRDQYDVGRDTHQLAVSPDGRMVVATTTYNLTTTPTLTTFFIKDDGSITLPQYFHTVPVQREMDNRPFN